MKHSNQSSEILYARVHGQSGAVRRQCQCQCQCPCLLRLQTPKCQVQTVGEIQALPIVTIENGGPRSRDLPMGWLSSAWYWSFRVKLPRHVASFSATLWSSDYLIADCWNFYCFKMKNVRVSSVESVCESPLVTAEFLCQVRTLTWCVLHLRHTWLHCQLPRLYSLICEDNLWSLVMKGCERKRSWRK